MSLMRWAESVVLQETTGEAAGGDDDGRGMGAEEGDAVRLVWSDVSSAELLPCMTDGVRSEARVIPSFVISMRTEERHAHPN